MSRPLRRSIHAIATFSALAIFLAFIATVGANPASAGARPAQIVTIARVSLDQPLRADSTSVLTIDATVAPGWHINSNRPLSPYYIPAGVSIAAPAGVKAGPVTYPPAQIVKLDFPGADRLAVFSGNIEFKVPLIAGADFKPAAAEAASAKIAYQACDNHECLRPAAAIRNFELAVPAGAGGLKSVSDATHDPPPPGGAALARVFSQHGYFLGFILVLLGGLALNLTPCVYPLIGVTIAYFGNQGGSHRRVASLAITYVIGIALMFSAVGVAVALSGGVFGAAMQSPYVLTAIAAVLVLLALSSFGVFSIQAPQWMMRWAGASRPGYVGALAMGFGMGVVAAPCIGPIVLGLLLMVERSGNPLFGFALFFTLAVGLGIPYVGLALAAGSIRRLPRSGEWLRWTEELFGFVLIGLALYFLEPVVPHHIINRALPFYAVGAGIFLGFISPAGRHWRPFLVFRLLVGTVAVAGLIYLIIPRHPGMELGFHPFSQEALVSARTSGKPVLIDFSADWCIPCREMEHTTFADPDVIKAASRFIRLRADLTEQNMPNAEITHHFEIQGVPTTIFIDSGGRVARREVGYVGPNQFLHDLRAID
ncbi:MAG: cytochrome c biogenesis protein CcdA [Candidatus Binataceae bacterium]